MENFVYIYITIRRYIHSRTVTTNNAETFLRI